MNQEQSRRWLRWGAAVVSTAATVYGWQQQIWVLFAPSLVTAVLTLGSSFWGGFFTRLNERLEELGRRLADWLVDRLSQVWQAWATLRGFTYQYRRYLIEAHEELETEGLQTDLPALDLEDVFVPLQVHPEYSQRLEPSLVPTQEKAGHLEIWDFLRESQSQGDRKHPTKVTRPRLAVVAPAGYGKSTLLHHLALTYAKQQHRRYQVPDAIPILVRFRDLARLRKVPPRGQRPTEGQMPDLRDYLTRITSPDPPTLADLLQVYVQSLPSEPALVPPAGWVTDLLNGGRGLVMLDGLDEVTNDEQRRAVSVWVSEQVRRYRRTAFILTSRPTGYDSEVVRVRLVLEVLPFTPDQVKQFLRNWYKQIEVRRRPLRKRLRVEVMRTAEDKAMQLFEAILAHAVILKLARNPLLVTMIAHVGYECGGDLPRRRVEVYQRICSVLLKRPYEKKIDLTIFTCDLTPIQSQTVLQTLAFTLMQQEVTQVTREEFTEIVQAPLLRVKPELDVAFFLEYIWQICGLLVERQAGIYEFAHKSFQEYLAAAHIKETQQEALLCEKFLDKDWEETIRLYAAQSADATALIQHGLSLGTQAALELAYTCIQEGAILDQAVREQLQKQVATSGGTQVSAEAKLAQRLGQLLAMGADTAIDLTYVTVAEYQLFIDAQKTGAFHQLPTGIIQPQVGSQGVNQPVTGIPFTEVLLFCTWLRLQDTVQAGIDQRDYFYRLPTADEVQRFPAIEQTQKDCWMDEKSNPDSGIRIVRETLPERYQKLANYLATGQWQEADRETWRVMCEVANRTQEGLLRIEDIEQFPCADLRWINQLWVQASGGRFGFTVQKQIWQDCGSPTDYNEQWKQFGSRVGWYVKNEWIDYPDGVTFSTTALWLGHLPSKGVDVSVHSRLFSRVQTCKL